MTGTTPERALVARCRQGDEQAFRELVDQFKGLVFGLVSRGVADRARAEEIAQEVFLRVHRGLPYFRGDAKLSTWIYRIVINLLSEERPDRASVSLDAPRPGEDTPAWEPGGPDRAFEDMALRDRLDKAIRRLPVHYQVLVNGHYLKGLQYDELAAALELPMGTVKTHLYRAKRELRRLLETELGDMRCDEADLLIDAVAAGEELPDAALQVHVASCPRCEARLDLARSIEALLAIRETPEPPERFTAGVMTRIRRDRWRAEQLLDAGFNLAVVFGLLLIAGGVAGLGWSLGLFGADWAVLTLVSTGATEIATRMLPQAPTVAVASVLLISALGLWWWAEEGFA